MLLYVRQLTCPSIVQGGFLSTTSPPIMKDRQSRDGSHDTFAPRGHDSPDHTLENYGILGMSDHGPALSDALLLGSFWGLVTVTPVLVPGDRGASLVIDIACDPSRELTVFLVTARKSTPPITTAADVSAIIKKDTEPVTL